MSGNIISRVLGSVKHFFGDGATFYGAGEGNNRDFDNNGINTIKSINKNIPLVSVLISGRSLLINQIISSSCSN